jgi:hypothetical protein
MKGYIYSITQIDTDTIVYIGSTKQRLFCMRKGDHTKPSTKPRPITLYVLENNGWDNFNFNCIEEIDFTDIKDLRKKEQYYIDLYHPTQNKRKASQTHEEYLERKRKEQKRFRMLHPDYHKRFKSTNIANGVQTDRITD